MKTSFGGIRTNYHKISKTLDANNQVTSISKLENIVCVTNADHSLKCTIANNVATVTEAGYVEGDSVNMWLCCTRPSEGGGICERIIVQADEDTWQEYLDML